MIDVHPPHSAIHGWRDFFIHIATITIGLLIALSLEAMVEGIHHREIVREARENIRHEIFENQTQVENNISYVQADAEYMRDTMRLVRDLRFNSHVLDHQTLRFTFSWSSFNDSAWLSARDSGGLTYMPKSEVQSYADAYKHQTRINEQASAIFAYQAELTAPLLMEKEISEMLPADVHDLTKGCAIASTRLTIMKQLMEQLRVEYKVVLAK